jgi:Protein of unknown function (DUF3102)
MTTRTPVDGSNYLADLAGRIRVEHEATATALKSSVEHAMAAGDLLIEAKSQLKHGQWLPWLTEHCALSERTAQLYMRTAKHRATIEDQIRNGVADLSLNEAAALLVLSSNIEKLLTFMKQLENAVDGEEMIRLCLEHGVGVISTPDYNPFARCDEVGKRDWHLFMLFLVREWGWYVDGAWCHIEYLCQKRFTSPCDWLGDEPRDGMLGGASWRKQQGIREPGDEFKAQWSEFLQRHHDAQLPDIEAQLEALHNERGPMPPPPSKPSRRRR